MLRCSGRIFMLEFSQNGWFVMVKEEPSQINVVLNWFEELKRLVPTP